MQGPHILRGLEIPSKHTVVVDKADSDDASPFVMVCIGGKQCSRYNVDEQSIATTWFAPSSLNVTANVARDKKRDRYAAVLNANRIVAWDGKEAETKLDKMKEAVKLSDPVSGLLNGSGGEMYVVFGSGRVQTINYVLRERNQGQEEQVVLPEGVEIVKSWLREVKGQNVITHLCQNKNKNKKERLLVTGRLTADPETTETAVVDVRKKTLGKEMVGILVSDNLVFLVDSDGTLTSETLSDDSDDITPICNVGKVATHGVVMAQFDQDYLCVAANNKLVLLNVAFSTVVAELDLDQGAPEFLTICGNRILFRQGTNLAMATVAESDLPRTVANMIGCNRMNNRETTAEFENVQTVDKASETLEMYRTLPAMFDAKNVAGVRKVLERNFTDIPELLVLSIIEFAFLLKDKDFAGSSGNAQVERERMLSRAFDVPVTESLIISHICQIDFSLALKMLDFVNLSLRLEVASGVHSERFLRLVEWAAMLLNAHYANVLLLSREDEKVAELLEDVARTVEDLEATSSLCAAIEPLAKLIYEKKYREPAYANKTYCIEIVDL